MSKEQLVLRMLCSDGRIDAHRLRTGRLQEKDWARLAKAYADRPPRRSSSTTRPW
jgi:replicative DNA helicase